MPRYAAAMQAAIVGIAGPILLPDEAALFRRHPPAGVILFARNIHDPPAARRTGRVAAARPAARRGADGGPGGRPRRSPAPTALAGTPAGGRAGPVLRRQPGRRAARGVPDRGADRPGLSPPPASTWPPRRCSTSACRAPATWSATAPSRRIRWRWRGSGAPWPPDCWRPASSRWASTRPGMAAPWSIPTCALPRVHASDLRADLLPFGLNTDLPWLMTAHIVYAAWDPILPATVSRAVIGGIIRGRLGFGGVIVSDDLAMQALSGTPAQRAAAALAAGCDIALYCAGDLAPTAEMLATCPPLGPDAAARLARRGRWPHGAAGRWMPRRSPPNGIGCWRDRHPASDRPGGGRRGAGDHPA